MTPLQKTQTIPVRNSLDYITVHKAETLTRITWVLMKIQTGIKCLSDNDPLKLTEHLNQHSLSNRTKALNVSLWSKHCTVFREMTPSLCGLVPSDGGVKKVKSERSWEYTDGHPLTDALWCCVKVFSHSKMCLLTRTWDTSKSFKKLVCLNSDSIEMNGTATGLTVKYFWHLKFYHSFCVVWSCRVESDVISLQSAVWLGFNHRVRTQRH